eukprot:3325023-Pyramimonas_sp.AAC.2
MLRRRQLTYFYRSGRLTSSSCGRCGLQGVRATYQQSLRQMRSKVAVRYRAGGVPAVVEADAVEGGAGEVHGSEHVLQVGAHQHEVRRLHRH